MDEYGSVRTFNLMVQNVCLKDVISLEIQLKIGTKKLHNFLWSILFFTIPQSDFSKDLQTRLFF